MSVWDVIETSPAAAAALVWRQGFGPDFAAAAALCLRETQRRTDRVPCPQGCGCAHRVVSSSRGLVGVCDCEEPDCEDLRLRIEDTVVWELDLAKLGRALVRALGCNGMQASLGLPRTLQVGSLGDGLPIVLTLQSDEGAFRSIVSELVVRLPKGFVLLAPTSRLCTVPATEMLARVNAGFFSLERHVSVLPGGRLDAARTGAELFKEHLPEQKETITGSESARVWRLFSELLGMGTKWKAPPARVFDLMVFKNLTKAQTALECKCAASSITKRVALIEGHFNMPIERLRAFASDLKERQRTVKGDRYAKKKHGAVRGEPEQYEEGDTSRARQDDEGYLPEEKPGYS